MPKVTSQSVRYKLPKSSRIVSSDDFGRVLHSKDPGVIRFGRDSVSLCALMHGGDGHVRIGFTVGKRNVPRSVDRALVKRILRESARHHRPYLVDFCTRNQVNMDVSLRLRVALSGVGQNISVSDAKKMIRQAGDSCLRRLQHKLPEIFEKMTKC